MSERKFVRISQKISWSTVEAGDIDTFCRACGFDLFNVRGPRHYRYYIKTALRRGLFLSQIRPTMRARFFELWRKWKESQSEVNQA